MRDRTLPMKWVEDAARECGGDGVKVEQLLLKRGVRQRTIDDQLRRLKKHSLIGSTSDHAGNDVLVDLPAKPFRPAPKAGLKKKK